MSVEELEAVLAQHSPSKTWARRCRCGVELPAGVTQTRHQADALALVLVAVLTTRGGDRREA